MDVIAKKAADLAAIIVAAKSKNSIRELAFKILGGVFGGQAVAERDARGEINQLFNWTTAQIRYTSDPHATDIFEEPEWTARVSAGDCDAATTLLGAMLQSVGHPVAIKVVSYDGTKFSHVYPEVMDPGHPGNWIPLDTTLENPQVGQELPYLKARRFLVEG